MRKIAAAAAAVAGAAAIITSIGTAGAASAGAGTGASWGGTGAARPGSQLWVKRYKSPGNGARADSARGMAVSPDGKTVYVTGSTAGGNGDSYTTVAYRAATGAQRWISHEQIPVQGSTFDAIAIAADGRRVYVTGSITTPDGTDSSIGTVAYNAATGARLWRVLSPGGAMALAVSPDGTKIFVAGWGGRQGSTTTAYDAATGTQLWTGNAAAVADSVAVSPDGKTVYATGTTGNDYATVAYSAATGTLLWAKTYASPSHHSSEAYSLAVSPDGTKVLVTGDSDGGTNPSEINDDFATVAYGAKTGAQLWVRRYNSHGDDIAYSLAVSPDGKSVYVTGTGGLSSAYTTIAYRTATGARLWIRHYNVSKLRGGTAYSVAVGPAGKQVFVTGASGRHSGNDYATVAYRAANGAQLWARRYNGPANGEDSAVSVAVSPTMPKVFVTGTSMGLTSGNDFLTIAYQR
jgi:DNA-binding beta-propeller fold protein YncE